MADDDDDPLLSISPPSFLFLLLLLFHCSSPSASQATTTSDTQTLLNLKTFFQQNTAVNRGIYSQWNINNSDYSSCSWSGISCNPSGRVTAIRLSDSFISGTFFPNFSSFSYLRYLDLSMNTISGRIPTDLSACSNLVYLNLSHNILDGGLFPLRGLRTLQIIDIAMNRISGDINEVFFTICASLISINISSNYFSGDTENAFDSCMKLEALDISSNDFTGGLWHGFTNLLEFSAAENMFTGFIPSSSFTATCRLHVLDLSENSLSGNIPREISACGNLSVLYLWGNRFTGLIPSELGLLPFLRVLSLGNNSFSRRIPSSLLLCKELSFLDLSSNGFHGELQPIFGKLTQLKSLVLQGNHFTDGLISSGILELGSIFRLDLSFNRFTGELPLQISKMTNLTTLSLSGNMFNGSIPSEYGDLRSLQALDFSFNQLSGEIPPEIGNLGSLLWLMLANNTLSGRIPPELGSCHSLLWVNLANNMFTGGFPVELTAIGAGAWHTFAGNRLNMYPDSGDCMTVRRWIPASYQPFNFAYTMLTTRRCRFILNRLFNGYGVFPVCGRRSPVQPLQFSGYLQFSGNRLTGDLPAEIGKMANFSLIHLGDNMFRGRLPAGLGRLPLFVLNVSANRFSGEIPPELGNMMCLQTLDLSINNFSGEFPSSLCGLTDMTRFNISYNPFLTGVVPAEGQFTTFDRDSFLGNPLLHLPSFINTSYGSHRYGPGYLGRLPVKTVTLTAVIVFVVMAVTISLCGVFFCVVAKTAGEASHGYLLENTRGHDGHVAISSSNGSSPWLSDAVKVVRLDRTAFTHQDILNATGNFSNDRILGAGGFGTVYRGVLPDGREVAIKKLQREGIEAEKEFKAEMEVLSGAGLGWPHPNLVTLYGWCLDGREKLLVYEYMQGGSLEEVIPDVEKLTRTQRVDVAADVARALSFLHHECYPAVVHRDVKASNVLLDKEGRARVTDFGLARVVDDGDSHVSTVVAGTVGYVAPEYGQTWRASPKGDVYSFGVVVMELATCRLAITGGEDDEECLVEWVRRVAVGAGAAALEPVWGVGTAEDMWDLLVVGIRCTVEAPQGRPTMAVVIEMINNIKSYSTTVNS